MLDRLLPSQGTSNAGKAQTQKAPISESQSKLFKPTPVHTSVPSTIVTRLKAIIAEEAGIDITELNADISFADFGIDSLLSITVASRVQEELNLNMTSSSFSDFPTLNDLINHYALSTRTSSHDSLDSMPHSDDDENDRGNSTENTSVDGEPDIMAMIRTTIAEEVGVPIEDLTATTDLMNLGVDSLLSLNIIEKLNQLDVDVPSNLLEENHTLQEIEKTLGQNDNVLQIETPHPVVEDQGILDEKSAHGPPFASSIRLQGPMKGSKKTFWLFPDGAGSATSYSSLPVISSDIVVHGLNCPWLKTPQDLRCTLPQYVSKFITEIKRKQPTGPYNLGGWSAGGILAYEAAQQLARSGEQTSNLILLDSPNPIGIQSPPKQMYDFLESLDMFSMNGRQPPNWLRPHFTAFITMLDQYLPVAFPSMASLNTHLIYARDGLCKNPGDPRPDLPEGGPEDNREMYWLLNNRTDTSGRGWKDLVGEKNLRVSVVEDANHYTMLRTAGSASKVSQMVAGFLAN